MYVGIYVYIYCDFNKKKTFVFFKVVLSKQWTSPKLLLHPSI